jgi:predicted transcriptional regulator
MVAAPLSASQSTADSQSEILTVLTHPIRLQMLKHLLCEPMSVNSLKSRLQKRQDVVWRHLQIMRKAGIVGRQDEGSEEIYSIPSDLRRIKQGVPVLQTSSFVFRSDLL